MDMYYQTQVKTLEVKLAYIQATYTETEHLADKEQVMEEKRHYNVLFEMMD